MSRIVPPSRLDPDVVVTALVTFINTSIMARGRPVHEDDNLEAAGVDSMALLKVLLFIESEFGFWIPDEDLVDENVASPRALARYICRRRSASA
jgi:acyl carrier protein